jgi:hypothetical protein
LNYAEEGIHIHSGNNNQKPDPQVIISRSLSFVARNYGSTPALLTGFYREGVRKRTSFIVFRSNT